MFRITWRPGAQLDTFEFWALADPSQQSRISASINELERRLALDPVNEGEGREGNIRVTVERPLGIEFFVDTANKTVRVERAWLLKERS